MNSRETYQQAFRDARNMGARHVVMSSERQEIYKELYRRYGAIVAADVMAALRPTRNLEDVMALFALMSWSHKSEDHWRQLQRQHGIHHPIAESAYRVYRDMEDLYYTESEKHGGLISINECSRIVEMWRNAGDRAEFRAKYGPCWQYTVNRIVSQIKVMGRASLKAKGIVA